MSSKVHVDLGDRAYDIHIGRGVRPTSLPADKGVRAALVVTDSNVGPLYGDACEEYLQSMGIATHRAEIPAGESSKDIVQLQNLYHSALAAGLDRSSMVVALGGGVVGDLAGFAAASYLRGVPLLQIPTSLLSMVDSSVGGKTGINLPEGKNLVGAFYQPVEVCADVVALQTLEDREYLSGLAEVVKYGIIWDAVLFERLENNVDSLRGRDLDLLEEVVARCCEIKAEVVVMDEKESGVRAILNFGHTLGHAVERAAGYGRWLHGEAVAVGMAYAARLSSKVKGFSCDDADRVCNLLSSLGLPVGLGDDRELLTWEAIRKDMAADKKTRHNVPRLVLSEGLGSALFGCQVDETDLSAAFALIQG